MNEDNAERRLTEGEFQATMADPRDGVLGSDDLQQSIQAAYVLVEKGDADAALKRAPDLPRRAATAALRHEVDRFEWVAVQVLLKIGASDLDYRRALQGVPPGTLHEFVRNVRKQAEALNVPFPTPLLRHYLLNFRSDDESDNANQARRFVRDYGKESIAVLRECAGAKSLQTRRFAAGLLLDFGETELPPSAVAALIGADKRALPLLKAQAADAVPSLREVMAGIDREAVLLAGRALLDLDPKAHREEVAHAALRIARQQTWNRATRLRALDLATRAAVAVDLEPLLDDEDPHVALAAAQAQVRLGIADSSRRALPLAVENLAADGNEANARMAAELLVLLGDGALPTLRRLLASDDEQVVASAAVALNRLGKLLPLSAHAEDALFRAAAWGVEEPGAMLELMVRVPAVRDELLRRLKRSGSDGALRALELNRGAVDWLRMGLAE